MSRAPNQRGFTLLELLIAVAIFALLGLGTYRMLDSVLRSDEATRAQEQVLRELARAFWSLERDVLQASARPVRDAYGDERAVFLGESKALDGSVAFELTRSGWRNPTGVQRSQLQRVRWRLAGQTLERVYWVVLDPAVDSEPRVQKVLNDVIGMEVRYRDKDGEWRDDWPSAQNAEQAAEGGGLPQALELTLEHRRYGKLVRLLRLPDEPAASQTGDIPQVGDPENPDQPEQPQQPPGEPPAGLPGETKP